MIDHSPFQIAERFREACMLLRNRNHSFGVVPALFDIDPRNLDKTFLVELLFDVVTLSDSVSCQRIDSHDQQGKKQTRRRGGHDFFFAGKRIGRLGRHFRLRKNRHLRFTDDVLSKSRIMFNDRFEKIVRILRRRACHGNRENRRRFNVILRRNRSVHGICAKLIVQDRAHRFAVDNIAEGFGKLFGNARIIVRRKRGSARCDRTRVFRRNRKRSLRSIIRLIFLFAIEISGNTKHSDKNNRCPPKALERFE